MGFHRIADTVRTLRWSTWLGWLIESNWANPWLFTLYLVVKPITGSLMLVAMFYAADAAITATGRSGVPAGLLPYVYISNAIFGMVGCVMFGMSYVVTSDRESYRMLKYIFISPAHFQAYFLGRGLARAMEGCVGAAITIAAGLVLPGIRTGIDIAAIDGLWLAAFLGLGFVMLWAAGMTLAAFVLNLSRSSSFLSEGLAGVVYFLSGVLFPLAILPGWLETLGRMLPTTYWLEGVRRSLTGPPAAITLADGTVLPPTFAGWSQADLFVMLAVTTLGLVIIAQLAYRYNVSKAWRNGKIEETTGM
jgi:ABC-2 type transport system permease protein